MIGINISTDIYDRHISDTVLPYGIILSTCKYRVNDMFAA